MKVGVIGCGGMGTTHYLALKALGARMDVEVTALADVREEFLNRAMTYFPGARAYREGMDLIEHEELDALHICLPSYLHTSHAIAAMERGMNVLIEKPVCVTKEEGERLLETQQKTGVKVMVGQVLRAFEEYQFLKQAYDSLRYGKLKSIVMHRLSGDVNWGFADWFHDEKKSGSVVLDLHIHDLDFLRYMLGEPDAFSVRATAFESGMINQIVTTYDFGDVFATAEGLWDVCGHEPFRAGYRAHFEDATICFDNQAKPAVMVYGKDGTAEGFDLKPEYDVTDTTAGINISKLGPYYTEIKYFLECIRDDKAITLASLEDGVRSVWQALREWEAAKDFVKG